MKLTEKEAWLLIAESYCGEIHLTTYAWNNRTGYGTPVTGICWRVHSLKVNGYIRPQTFNNMMAKIKNDLGRKVYFSPSRDLEARSLYCILQAEQC